MDKFALFLTVTAALVAASAAGCQISSPAHPAGTQANPSVNTVTATFSPAVTRAPTEGYTPTFVPHPTQTPYPPPGPVLSAGNAAQIRQLARLGKGNVNALVYSPDGHYLAVGTSIGVAIYDTQTWSETMIELETGVIALEFSPKGNVLGVGLDNGLIQLWQVPQWSVMQTLVYNSVEPFVVRKGYWQGLYQGLEFQQNVGETENVVVFSPNGDFVAAGGLGKVKLWRASDGAPQETIIVDCFVSTIAFSPDGKTMAVSACGVTLWQIPDGKEIYQFEGYSIYQNSSPVYFKDFAFSADGKSLIGWSGEVIISWQVSDGKVVRGYTIPGWERASDLAPDGKTLAIATNDLLQDDPISDALTVWDLDSAQKHRLSVSHPDLIYRVALAPDRATLAASFADGNIQVLSIADSTLLQTLAGFPVGVDDVVISPNGSEFVSFAILFQHAFLQRWNLAEGTIREVVDVNAYGAHDARKMVFSPDGTLLAVASKDLHLWDFKKGVLLQTFQGDQENLYSDVDDVVFSPDGKTIAYSFSFGKVTLAATSGEVIRTLETADSGGGSLCYFSDGQTLMTDGATQFWNLANGKLLQTTPSTYGRWFFFTPGCDLFAAMTWDGYFKVLRNTPEQFAERLGVFDLRAQGIYVTEPVAFSPDRNLVAVQEAIGKIRIFSLQTKKTVAVLSGHKGTLTSLNFTLDGKLLISSSRDGTIRLWGVNP